MSPQDYREFVLGLEAKPAELKISAPELKAILSFTVLSSSLVDYLKKTIIYGTEVDLDRVTKITTEVYTATCDLLNYYESHRDARMLVGAENLQTADINIRLLHAALGMFGEAGEFAEVVLDGWKTGDLDQEKAIKELGDCCWYPEVAYDELGVTSDEVRELNKLKLQHRYKTGRFSTEQAVDRVDSDPS
jgi:NTP pyrophosphatase (non-canonical NTP hydrolase)